MHKTPIATIQTVVAEAYGVTVADMVGASRREPVITARLHAVHLCAVLLRASLGEVAKAFGYTGHTAVVHTMHSIEARIETEPDTRELHQRLMAQCQAAIGAVAYAGPLAGDGTLSAQCHVLDALHNLKLAYAVLAAHPQTAGYRIDTAMAQLGAAREALALKEESPA